MRRDKSKRIDVNPNQSGLADLSHALAGLNLGPLPPAPPEVVALERAKSMRMGRVVLRKETAHRGGKVVIVIHEFAPTITDGELERLAKGLRQAIGTGGTVRERTIEIQGEHTARVRELLEGEGFQVAGVR